MDIGKDLQRAYDDGYEQGKQDAMKWIPVTEELPTINETVLIYGKSRYRFQKVFCKFVDVGCLEEPEADRDIEKWSTYNDWYEGQEDFTITHWMTLPEPPKDGEV